MKKRITQNIGMKIIALVIAVFLWIIINGLTDPITTRVIKDIPVELINEDEMESIGKIFEVLSGQSITIKVRAKRSLAEKLAADDFTAIADVTKKSELNAVEIVVSYAKGDTAEVEILEKKTENGTGMMMLSLEESDMKSFAITVVPNGIVADGYYITESMASPNLLTITGSKTQIAKIAKIAVLVDVNGASGSFTQSGTPIAYDENGNVIASDKLRLSAEKVQVSMTLLPTKLIDLNITATGKPFYNYTCTSIKYAPLSVLVAGHPSDLADITSLSIECDTSYAREDVEAELSIEEALLDAYGNKYILVDDNTHVSVKATIEQMLTKEITILTSSISFLNLSAGLRAECTELTTILRVVGIAEAMEGLTAAQLQPYVDCSSYVTPGTYSVVVRAQAPENVEVKIATIELVITKAENTKD